MSRVGQNHTIIGIYGVHTVFLAGKSPYIRSYTPHAAYIRFWPTLGMRHIKLRAAQTVNLRGRTGSNTEHKFVMPSD